MYVWKNGEMLDQMFGTPRGSPWHPMAPGPPGVAIGSEPIPSLFFCHPRPPPPNQWPSFFEIINWGSMGVRGSGSPGTPPPSFNYRAKGTQAPG